MANAAPVDGPAAFSTENADADVLASSRSEHIGSDR
jgi:hypothetical protein